MAKYKAYPEYKDSGVEWIDSIPSYWEVKPTFALCDASTQKNIDGAESNVLSLSYGNIIPRDVETNFGLLPESFNTYQVISCGNVILRLTDLQNDKNSLRVGLAKQKGIITSAYLKLKANSDINPNFLYRLLHSYDTTKVFYGMGGGLRQSMKFEDFRRLPLLLPPYEEQIKISAFLDHETAKIDNLIEKQQQLIELLKEKRQAVISHAVTKGLNPGVPMKDSGVEWLGEVPAHWKVSKLKYFTSIQGGFAFSSDSFTHEGVQILRIGNLYQNNLELERQPIFLDVNELDRFRDFAICKDDILMSLTGTLGKRDYGFAIKVDRDDVFLLNQRVAKITPDETRLCRDFLLYILWSDSYLNQLYSLPSGTKQANLSNSNVTDILVACPAEISEQKSIIEMVIKQMEVFDSLMDNSLNLMESLQERRTALISAAVTGKIDVRDWVAPETQDIEETQEATA
ncbi:restriction endonuclease subunit S [Enterobacter hormaechei]|uniref:restriction endonuclease subunit S n=1 Tax=Enterobacter hormaechei TaxID=158836 RepID=UPI000628252F|nr:restriction endonuclease subunit S [Enterobacter hormaechei]KKJ27451.1 hypothetical protein T637_17895 [Enterobacter hormaechei subsp. hoffmannii]